jgi:hypothetical protein
VATEGNKIGADGQGLQARAQGGGAPGPVKAGDYADTGLLKCGGDVGQKIRTHLDVHVGDHQQVVTGVGLQLPEGAHLGVQTQGLRADDDFRPTLGKGREEFLKQGQDRVARVLDPEQDLVRLVVLIAKTLQTFPGGGIEAFEGLEHGNSGQGRGGPRPLGPAAEAPQAGQG